MDSLIDGLYQRKFTADKGQPRRKGMAKLEEWLGGHGAEECAGMGTRLAERARDHLAWGGQAERAKAKVGREAERGHGIGRPNGIDWPNWPGIG